ncbi:MAG: hypothetical protein JWM38_1565 [Sphingomonas bacterium]|nr:hypothetical protein [Sphingomonas bacterium]
MKRPPNKAALLALAASIALLSGLPASGQESLLPEGFGDPAPPPLSSAPAAAPAPGEAAGTPASRPPSSTALPPSADGAAIARAEEEDEEEAAGPVEIPDWARRPIDVAGVLGPDGTGLGNAFGNADGTFLSTLMRRIEAPIASRWGSILLRRALLSRVPTPDNVPDADWIAERAWLLLRMGEADGARMLVQGVDVDRFSPKLLAVAAQTALATADPAGLCPLVVPGQAQSKEPIWPLAAAMCAALSGEAAASGSLIDRARRARVARGVDLFLAEKVVGAGGGRRQINIEWDGVEGLTSWRFGLATALGVTIPEPLFETVGPQVKAWQARSPMVPLAARIEAARIAAALGVFSNAALVDLYSALADETDPLEVAETPAGKLRNAYVGDGDGDRMTALRGLWGKDRDELARYGDAVLTARAAARIRPDEAYSADAAALIGAMYSAGLDYQADRWAPLVEGMSAGDADPAWAILAVGSPRPRVEIGYRRVSAFADRAGSDGRHRAQLLFAGLAGLGRIGAGDQARLAEELGVPVTRTNRWTRALDLAVASGQPGTVAILAAVGMQSRSWAAVPPAYLYHIVSALRRVGREGDARMIAAEAMSRT